MPVGSTVVVRYDGTDITNKVLFRTASFESQINATPGTFEITVKDEDQNLSFTTGKEVTLDLDGQRIFGGFVTMIGRKFAIPVDNTSAARGGPDAVKTRQWVLRGVDYNIWFDKRVLRNASNPTKRCTSFDPERYIGDLIRNDLVPTWIDTPPGLTYTAATIEDVAQMPWDHVTTTFAWMEVGSTWRKQMEDFTTFNGARYYIDANKALNLHSLPSSRARWGFSDVPNKRTVTGLETDPFPTYGFREIDGTEDGSLIINDALIWGGSTNVGGTEAGSGGGGVVFARRENQDSQDLHGRWQLAETHFGEQGFGIQQGVDVRAETIVNGTASGAGQQEYGFRNPQWQFRFSWFGHDVPLYNGAKDHLIPGQLVTMILYTFGADSAHPLIKELPLRQVRISFPDLDPDGKGYVRFDGYFAIQANDPWTIWRFLLKNERSQTQAIINTVTNANDSCAYGDFGNFYPIEPTDGTRRLFSIALSTGSPVGYIGGTTQVYLNGILLRAGADYSEFNPAAGQIQFFVAPAAGSWIWITCRTMASGGETATVSEFTGWNLVFEDTFTTWNASRYFVYPNTWTNNYTGHYDPNIISSDGSKLRIHLHTEGGYPRIAAFCPIPPGSLSNRGDLNSMRVAFRVRADSMPGYKGVPLLWPMSNNWPRDGEIDWPESHFDAQPAAFMHRQDATVGSDQDWYGSPSGTSWQDWHEYAIEWISGVSCEFFIDGISIGKSTSRVPNTPMHLVMQFETQLNMTPPSPTVSGYVEIDYLKVWVPA